MCLVKNVTKLAAQTISTKFQMRLNRLLLMQHFGFSPEKKYSVQKLSKLEY